MTLLLAWDNLDDEGEIYSKLKRLYAQLLDAKTVLIGEVVHLPGVAGHDVRRQLHVVTDEADVLMRPEHHVGVEAVVEGNGQPVLGAASQNPLG